MPLQALSLGREVDVWKPQRGRVHSVFAQAVNLLVEGELWTVLGAVQADAPFGIRLASHGGGLEVKVGERVDVRAGFVRVGKVVIDGRTAVRWAPWRWARPVPGLEARLCSVECSARSRAWTESAGLAADVIDALHGADADLAAAVRRTVGRGPGLTPAGDDVLAGLFAVLTSGAAGSGGAQAAARIASALAPALASTTDISRHLLRQAARGLPGRALHDLGRALIAGAPDDVLRHALDLVLDTGATSGADACMGLIAASRFAFFHLPMATA